MGRRINYREAAFDCDLLSCFSTLLLITDHRWKMLLRARKSKLKILITFCKFQTNLLTKIKILPGTKIRILSVLDPKVFRKERRAHHEETALK